MTKFIQFLSHQITYFMKFEPHIVKNKDFKAKKPQKFHKISPISAGAFC